MIPRACRTCGEPLQEQGGPGCACAADTGAGGGADAAAGAGAEPGGAREHDRRLVRPYVMKAPGPVRGPAEDEPRAPAAGPGPEPGLRPVAGPVAGPGVGPRPAPGAREPGEPGRPHGPGGGADGADDAADRLPVLRRSAPPARTENHGRPGEPGPAASGPGPAGPLDPSVASPAGPLDPSGATPAGPPGSVPPGPPALDDTLATPYAPLGASPDGPAAADLGLFADDPAASRGPRAPRSRDPRNPVAARRRRRLTLVLTVGGVVAALSAGLLGAGLFSDGDRDDRTVPEPDTVTALPTGGGTKPGPEDDDTRSGEPSVSARGGEGAEPSAGTSQPAEGEEDERQEEEGAQRNEAGQVTAAPPASAPAATGDPTSGTTPGERDEPEPPPTLREGDSGPEVVELQKRLIQAGYNRLTRDTDGEYGFFLRQEVARFQRDHGIEGDERGVYGPETRRALESMTDEP